MYGLSDRNPEGGSNQQPRVVEALAEYLYLHDGVVRPFAQVAQDVRALLYGLAGVSRAC